jgi:hypothetical protein
MRIAPAAHQYQTWSADALNRASLYIKHFCLLIIFSWYRRLRDFRRLKGNTRTDKKINFL